MNSYIILLRGINVGGNKKVPMAELKKVLQHAGYSVIKTLLNSGNVILSAEPTELQQLESNLEVILHRAFGFEIPVIVRNLTYLKELVESNPVEHVNVNENTRLYVSFSKEPINSELSLPYTSEDGSFRILQLSDQDIISVLELGNTKSTDAMKILEKEYGKNITTRNWNTVLKMVSN